MLDVEHHLLVCCILRVLKKHECEKKFTNPGVTIESRALATTVSFDDDHSLFFVQSGTTRIVRLEKYNQYSDDSKACL